MEHNLKKVIIVGAGPVGLLIAYMLGQRNIPVDVLEAGDRLNDSPRGLAYGPPAVTVLQKAGVFEEIKELGFITRNFSWRNLDGEYITGLDMDIPEYAKTPWITYPVGSMAAFLLQKAQSQPSFSVHWGHKVTEVGQDAEKAWVVVSEGGEAGKTIEGDIVVGCDGGQSGVRKALFGHSFPGFTWPMQLISNNIYYDFEQYGWSHCQWIVHPEHWFICAKINADGLWRVGYPEEPGISNEEMEKRRAKKLKIILPGHPDPGDYKIQLSNFYNIHQRLAERMRVGRILLAGDAAHLNNPMGGLGLVTGICDAGSLVDCLWGIDSGEASMDILDLYNEHRRRIFKDVTDAMSTANMERLHQVPDNMVETDSLFKLLGAAKADSEVAKKLVEMEMMIYCDMTQFYTNPKS